MEISFQLKLIVGFPVEQSEIRTFNKYSLLYVFHSKASVN